MTYMSNGHVLSCVNPFLWGISAALVTIAAKVLSCDEVWDWGKSQFALTFWCQIVFLASRGARLCFKHHNYWIYYYTLPSYLGS